MTDAEIIDRLAREVMGWKPGQRGTGYYDPSKSFYDEDGKRVMSIAAWNPPENIEQAIGCRKTIMSANPTLSFGSNIDERVPDEIHVMFYDRETETGFHGRAPTDAHAVCLAIMELLDEKEKIQK